MTSRTFALSRHRRRRTHERASPSSLQERSAALGKELERVPAAQRDESGRPVDPATHAAGARPAGVRLPHEHDEYADAPTAPRPRLVQAERDLAEGQVDTDQRGKAAEVFERNARRRPR